MSPLSADVETLIELALAEDIGPGDWTTLWTVPSSLQAEGVIVVKAVGVIAGTGVATRVFDRVDDAVKVEFLVKDGQAVVHGDEIARVSGPAQGILTAERVVLNFLQHLSGIATVTRAYVQAIAGTSARILDTRKTTPGMRRLEKAAVLAGGGVNHRFGLHDMILIKENHIRAAGGIGAALDAVKRGNVAGLPVEIEATTLDEVRQALDAGADRILFDNMSVEMLGQAVEIVRSHSPEVETEASGGITLKTAEPIARTGVDYLSIGALTHSAPALDLSLLIGRGERG